LPSTSDSERGKERGKEREKRRRRERETRRAGSAWAAAKGAKGHGE
jgi:hypothetical protein